MTRRLVALAAILVAAAAHADEAVQNDVRELRAGMKVAELPAAGYVGLACRDAPDMQLAAWGDYARCARDAAGLHEVAAEFDSDANPLARFNDKWEGTKVGGHPVRLTLLVGDDAVVRAIRIVTDPKARPYLRKRAYLFARQSKIRYGEEGWRCTEEPPAPGETPVGNLFVKQRCEKEAAGRRLLLDERLYRRADQRPPDFESAASLEIWALSR